MCGQPMRIAELIWQSKWKWKRSTIINYEYSYYDHFYMIVRQPWSLGMDKSLHIDTDSDTGY